MDVQPEEARRVGADGRMVLVEVGTIVIVQIKLEVGV